MWNIVSIPLASGVGNANLVLPSSQILGRVGIPAQAAITSGSTKIIISHLLPDPAATPDPLLTLNPVTTPYSEFVVDSGVNNANVAQTSSLFYPMVASINISITGGNGNLTAQVYLLTS